jgi:hypothetical protein
LQGTSVGTFFLEGASRKTFLENFHQIIRLKPNQLKIKMWSRIATPVARQIQARSHSVLAGK